MLTKRTKRKKGTREQKNRITTRSSKRRGRKRIKRSSRRRRRGKKKAATTKQDQKIKERRRKRRRNRYIILKATNFTVNHVIPIKYEWQDNAKTVNQYFIVQSDVKRMIGRYIQDLVMLYAKDITGFRQRNVLSVVEEEKECTDAMSATVYIIVQESVN